MKKTITLICGLLLISFLETTFAEEFCTKNASSAKMSFTNAEKLAKQNDTCLKVGAFKKHHWCNENSGTWWIMLNTKMKGCLPACVINIVDNSVSVNYMCMGLLNPKEKSKNLKVAK